MATEELKAAILEWFKDKSTGAKKKFYMQDVTKAFKDDYKKRDVQQAVNEMTEEGTIMYWSSGSTTMLVLTENIRD